MRFRALQRRFFGSLLAVGGCGCGRLLFGETGRTMQIVKSEGPIMPKTRIGHPFVA